MTQTLALSSEARHLQDWKTLFEFRISKPIVELKLNCKKEQAYYFLIDPEIVFRRLEWAEYSGLKVGSAAKLSTPSTPNNSNETYTFMG